jgi:hypothetical protein
MRNGSQLQTKAIMTLTQTIKSNPYLKVSNCSDKNDCLYGIEECKRLEIKYGQSKSLDKIWIALINKKNKLNN